MYEGQKGWIGVWVQCGGGGWDSFSCKRNKDRHWEHSNLLSSVDGDPSKLKPSSLAANPTRATDSGVDNRSGFPATWQSVSCYDYWWIYCQTFQNSVFFKKNWMQCEKAKTNFNIFSKKVQLDATICRHLFTAQSLYMFRVSQHPSSGVLKNCICYFWYSLKF